MTHADRPTGPIGLSLTGCISATNSKRKVKKNGINDISLKVPALSMASQQVRDGSEPSLSHMSLIRLTTLSVDSSPSTDIIS